MGQDGVLTAELADSLRSAYEGKPYRILSDHGDKSQYMGNIVSSIGRPGLGTELGQLDLAVIDKNMCAVVALIEVEETSDRPKTILGDVFATLLGSKTTFDGEKLTIDKRTTLIVLVPEVLSHRKRIHALDEAVSSCRPAGTGNAAIGKVRVLTFPKEKGPFEAALTAVHAAVSAARAAGLTSEEKLHELLDFVKAEGRVCPKPVYWDRLWKMLTEEARDCPDEVPAPPIILAAWVGTPWPLKAQRLADHICYVAAHGPLDRVDTFLRGLSPGEWHSLR